MRADLHTHSNASDGTDPPGEVVAGAARAGLDALALTDHDTTAGWDAARAAADEHGVRLIPGAELSTRSPGGVSVHVLAYLFDPDAPVLVAEQARMRAARRERLRRIVHRMAADGFPVDEELVFGGLDEDAPAGRPHLARALLKAGVVGSVSEAFEKYLRNGGPYYLRREDTPTVDAVRMIAAAGGVTVLAHTLAGTRARGGYVLGDAAIRELAEAGVSGLEVDHPEHDAEARSRLRFLAAELDLVATGGSDYHGDNKPIALGAEQTAPSAFDELLARAALARAAVQI